MSGIITSSYAEHIVPLPVNLATTLLNRGTWLVLGSFQVLSNETMQYTWAQLTVSDVGVAPHGIVNASGLVSFGLYKDLDAGLHPRTQSPIETIIYAGDSTTYTTVSALRFIPNTVYAAGTYAVNNDRYFAIDATELGAGTYYFVVANNTSDHDYHVTVSGVARLMR